MTKRNLIKSVAEIAINVNNIAKTQSFYEEVLGFEFFSQDPAENPTIVFLKIAGLETPLGRGGHPQLFVLIDVNRHPYIRSRYSRININQTTLNHLAFEIASDTFEAEKKRLERLGMQLEIHQFPNMNAKALFFSDPEGNRIELICHHKTN